jgi:hypothetical protein
MVETGTAKLTRRPGRQTRERKKDGERACARGDDGSGTYKERFLSLV